MQPDNIFAVSAAVTHEWNGRSEKDTFRYVYVLTHLADVGQDASTYDPELKMHFEDRSALGSIYRIDIRRIDLQFSRKLAKASDFIRRTNYANNRMEIRRNIWGVVKSVENKEKLKERWKPLRKKLSHEYQGRVVEQSLTKIDERLNLPDKILPAVYTYLNYGLLFPHIPPKHSNEWSNKRKILFPEYDEPVEECVTFTSQQDNMRRYDVQWATSPEQKMKLLSGKGYYFVPQDELFPVEAAMEVTFQYDEVIEWKFELKKY